VRSSMVDADCGGSQGLRVTCAGDGRVYKLQVRVCLCVSLCACVRVFM